MELLLEIKDKEWPADLSTLKLREASRAILFDENNLVPLLFVSKYNYHKLPGGGIDEGETKMQGLIREIKEEVGSEIEVTGEVGEIIEYRSKFNLKQISYCYYGKTISKGNHALTEDEIEDGMQLVWMTLDEAITQLEKDKPENYEGVFIQERDLAFLKKTKEII